MAFAGAFSPALPPVSAPWVPPDIYAPLEDFDLDAWCPPQRTKVMPQLRGSVVAEEAANLNLMEDGALCDAMAMLEKLQEATRHVAVLQVRLSGDRGAETTALNAPSSPRRQPGLRRCFTSRRCLAAMAPFPSTSSFQSVIPMTCVEGTLRVEGDPILDAIPVQETLGTVLLNFAESVVEARQVVLERLSDDSTGSWSSRCFKYQIFLEDPNDAEPLLETLLLEGLFGGARRLLPSLADQFSEDGLLTPRNLKVSLESPSIVHAAQ
mmetsp:Transcript_39486/g.92857  ORF Transcript_39486/g.92857 Transcript_39486/m.92857 type:complete len:266 (-) Transcript_39486:82-879(-)